VDDIENPAPEVSRISTLGTPPPGSARNSSVTRYARGYSRDCDNGVGETGADL
jgi:hypothetical protein